MTQLADRAGRDAARHRGARRARGARGSGFRSTFWAVVHVIGELAITFGVLVLLFVVYEVYFTNVVQSRSQHRLQGTLQQQWSGPAAPVDPVEGRPFALLKIPRLGAGYEEAVVEGVTHEDLKLGPGHYPGTALPGQVGNMVISGHRTTYGAPFRRVDELAPGDDLLIETRDTDFHYRVLRETVVQPSASEVLLPVPGTRGAVPQQRLLTLTTCNPPYSAKQRLVVVAELSGTSRRAG